MAGARQGVDQRRRAAAERLWLHYYNRVLFERGLITEAERNRIGNRIDAGPGSNFH